MATTGEKFGRSVSVQALGVNTLSITWQNIWRCPWLPGGLPATTLRLLHTTLEYHRSEENSVHYMEGVPLHCP